MDAPLLQAETKLHQHHVLIRHDVGIVRQELQKLLLKRAHIGILTLPGRDIFVFFASLFCLSVSVGRRLLRGRVPRHPVGKVLLQRGGLRRRRRRLLLRRTVRYEELRVGRREGRRGLTLGLLGIDSMVLWFA